MNILYIGDIMAEPGIDVVKQVLPDLKKERRIDLVIAQAENVTNGRGMVMLDFQELKSAGVDFFTGGNHTLNNETSLELAADPNQPVIRPANYPTGTPGLGYKYAKTHAGDVLVVSLLGHIVGRDAASPTDNPLKIIDQILKDEKDTPKVATVINFHGDFSSEKVVIGHYLDGRATLVLGDHWHVPTADARVLPGGTAHMTDVGMCGTLNSSLGVAYQSIIPRWRDDQITRNVISTKGPFQFSALLVKADPTTGLAKSAEHIYKILG